MASRQEKAAEIIALYMEPPQHAAVFCGDEKTTIQALDRLVPVLPLSPGVPENTGSNTPGMARYPSTQRLT
jgi:hypothetical protein